jgi:hypothetical protein
VLHAARSESNMFWTMKIGAAYSTRVKATAGVRQGCNVTPNRDLPSSYIPNLA